MIEVKIGQKLTQPHILITKFFNLYQTWYLCKINLSHAHHLEGMMKMETIIICDTNETNAGFRLACRSPLRRMISACFFDLSPSGIAPELNWSQLCAICRGGQSGKVIDLLARRYLPLGRFSAASDACAVVQISSSKRQCGERQASLKSA